MAGTGCALMHLMHGLKTAALEAGVPAPPQPPINPCSISVSYQQSTDISKPSKMLKINTLHLKWEFLEMLYVTIKIFLNILSKTQTFQNWRTSLK